MKKILALALALIMLLSVAALVHADEGVTITYMASQDWVQDAEMELAEKFTEKTGIKVDFQIIPSDQYTTLLMTKLQTGEQLDLFGSQAGKSDIVTQLNVEKNAVDLSGEAWVYCVLFSFQGTTDFFRNLSLSSRVTQRCLSLRSPSVPSS